MTASPEKSSAPPNRPCRSPRRTEDRPAVPAARRVGRLRAGDVEAICGHETGGGAHARGTVAHDHRRGHVTFELACGECAVVDSDFVDRALEVLPVGLIPTDPQRVGRRLDRSRVRRRDLDPVDEETQDGTVVRRREVRPATDRSARTCGHVADHRRRTCHRRWAPEHRLGRVRQRSRTATRCRAPGPTPGRPPFSSARGASNDLCSAGPHSRTARRSRPRGTAARSPDRLHGSTRTRAGWDRATCPARVRLRRPMRRSARSRPESSRAVAWSARAPTVHRRRSVSSPSIRSVGRSHNASYGRRTREPRAPCAAAASSNSLRIRTRMIREPPPPWTECYSLAVPAGGR